MGNAIQPMELKPNHTVTGPLLPEPVKIITLVDMGDSVKLIGEGMSSSSGMIRWSWFCDLLLVPRPDAVSDVFCSEQ